MLSIDEVADAMLAGFAITLRDFLRKHRMRRGLRRICAMS